MTRMSQFEIIFGKDGFITWCEMQENWNDDRGARRMGA